MKILEVKNLNVTLKNGKKLIDNVSFSLEENSVLGIIGESGSGKSTTTKAILKLLNEKTFNFSGKIFLEGQNISTFNEKQMQKVRGKKISVILQNPMTSLNPLVRIGNQMIETLKFHYKINKKNAYDMAFEALSLMEFENIQRVMKSYPYELSGGMLQRVIITIALLLKPKILIADEPTTALDIATRDIIIKEIMELKNKFGISIIYITHENEIIKNISDEIVVLKDGKIIEKGTKEKLVQYPKEQYTKTLLEGKLVFKEKVKIC
ncbi:ABC transporter ATP-binding protein [Inediibacterium massiliense]|uniref:ABC transporter ATP-binding protein n=1 Tax=Inediibacterium massiliense TaxID=1658111 RepID=UPI0006B4E19B|nr:ABC transporter ATP-binding protein [Inediibacterium massiliense]